MEKYDEMFLNHGVELLENLKIAGTAKYKSYEYRVVKMGRGVVRAKLEDLTVAYILGVEDAVVNMMERIDVYDCETKEITTMETVADAMEYVFGAIVMRILKKLDPMWHLTEDSLEKEENPPMFVWEDGKITLEWDGER